MRSAHASSVLILTAALLPVAGAAQLPSPKTFAPPAVTTWEPEGCRQTGTTAAAIPPRDGWTNLHGDVRSSDEVSIALPAVLRTEWTSETATYNPTGPVFDRAGNLYFSPLIPFENVVLISLDPDDGSRRWAIAGTGAPPGASAPMVLEDPADPGAQIVYLALYDRALAVRTDGTIVWDVPTGLALGGNTLERLVLGFNYDAVHDALVALTGDGHLFAVDRATGAPLLSAPYQLPGERSPSVPSTVPAAIMAAADTQFRTLVNVPAGTLPQFTAAILGNNVEVGNHFSIDPQSGRLWVAATAPDGEDGTLDGVSQLGALWGLGLVAGTSAPYQVQEVCHRPFTGGSASTPTISADGARVYLGDNTSLLLAIGSDCADLWSVDVGAQIFGSVVVSDDRREIYTSTALGITKVVDQGGAGAVAWTANLDVFNLASGQQNLNMNLVAAGANGLAFQAGAGVIINNIALPSIVGTGVLDRETGAVRSFAGGGEETVAVMSVGPDGALYLGNSPLRRIFARVLNLSPAPLVGGITKFGSERADLLMRDAACAAERRALNAFEHRAACPASALADITQLGALIDQIRATSPAAIAAGELTERRWTRLDRRLARVVTALADAEADVAGKSLRKAARGFRRACRVLN